MKIALAQFLYESNTFNPHAADLDGFTRHGTWLTEPAAIRTWASHGRSQLQGSLDALAAAGGETVPVFVAMCGAPGGRLSAGCHEAVLARS